MDTISNIKNKDIKKFINIVKEIYLKSGYKPKKRKYINEYDEEFNNFLKNIKFKKNINEKILKKIKIDNYVFGNDFIKECKNPNFIKSLEGKLLIEAYKKIRNRIIENEIIL